jgi:AcrR family transcriptional regulator
MTTSLRERRRQLLRDEILQAARELAAEKGHSGSMDELAARVGISKPTLYSHFATKEDLTIAAALQSMQRLMERVEHELPQQSPLQGLLLFLQATLEVLLEDGTHFRPITPELLQMLRAHPEAAAHAQRIDDRIRELVQQGIAQGELNPSLDPTTIVMVFHGIVHALKADLFLAEYPPSDPQAVLHTLLTVFERGIRRTPDTPA